jgi:hypothetical protein
MATSTYISVNMVDPVVSVDTLVWVEKHVYIDLTSDSDIAVTLTLTDVSVTDFVAEILRGAGVKQFAFNDVPSVTAEYYDGYGPTSEDEYFSEYDLYNIDGDFGLHDDDDELDEPVDQYGYSLYDYSSY